MRGKVMRSELAPILSTSMTTETKERTKKERPEDQDTGWLPTIQDNVMHLCNLIWAHEPPEECYLKTSGLALCPPARRNSCILPMTGYQPLGEGCPLRFCAYAERTGSLLNDFGISIDELLGGDCMPLALDLMLNLLKRRCVATDLDLALAEPKSPAAHRRWDAVRRRNSLRLTEILETRFRFRRDLKIRRTMPKEVRAALRRLKAANWDYLTPRRRAELEGRPVTEEMKLPYDPVLALEKLSPAKRRQMRARMGSRHDPAYRRDAD